VCPCLRSFDLTYSVCASREGFLIFPPISWILIWLNLTIEIRMNVSSQQETPEDRPMPTDALLLSLFICCVFALFAATLAWADYSTTKCQENREAKSKSDPLKKAA
jgi:hypothetical protein